MALLIQLDDLLGRHQVRYDVVVHDLRQRVEAESGPEVSDGLRTEVLGMFKGTMGSLNDVFITRSNGHLVDDEAEANRRMSQLTSALFHELTGV